MCGRDIEKSICREMSGNVESGMVAVGMLSRFPNLNQAKVVFRKHVEALSVYILKSVFTIFVSQGWKD